MPLPCPIKPLGTPSTTEDDVCLLDFGMVCLVPPNHRKVWAKCVVAPRLGGLGGGGGVEEGSELIWHAM